MNELENLNKLVESIRNQRVLLFVGAGVSKNLGLPSWEELIDKMADDLGYDRGIFKLLGDYTTLAEYYKYIKTTLEPQKSWLDPLRSWMDNKRHDQDIQIETSEIHRLIVELSFPLIYTTNYDRWLEIAFKHYGKDYITIANVRDILDVKDGMTQIVKFHGDFDNDASLVLTESSYFQRLDFESPLDIKLRADILGKTILFIGYSLSDINIRYLLYKLNKLWETSSHPEAKPNSYIFLGRPNPVLEEVLKRRGITTFFSNNDDNSEGLRTFLEDLKNKKLSLQDIETTAPI